MAPSAASAHVAAPLTAAAVPSAAVPATSSSSPSPSPVGEDVAAGAAGLRRRPTAAAAAAQPPPTTTSEVTSQLSQPAQPATLSSPRHQHSQSAPPPKVSLAEAETDAEPAAARPPVSSSSSFAPPFYSSFRSFLRGELLLDEPPASSDSSAPSTPPSQLVYNFLILPLYLERLLTLGFFICLECFLHLLTLLPIRILCSAIMAVGRIGSDVLGLMVRRPPVSSSASSSSPSRRRFSFSLGLRGSQWCDLARGLLLLVCWWGMSQVNMSRMYHYIRGQSVLKLYVIFNMLQISDRLFCSFGEDILEALFAAIMQICNRNGGGKQKPDTSNGASPPLPVQCLHTLFHLLISLLYVFCHSLLLFAQVVTLNVSVNSDNSSLFVVLVSNNFVELKSAVFKRFDHHNLMQISASDIVERVQLTVFLLVILVQNLAHIGWTTASALAWLNKAAWMFFMVLGGEWCVDWIKHGFITKFNDIPPIVYRHFGKVLCTDFIHTHRHKTESSIHSVSRRLGLPALPMAVLVIRVVSQAFFSSSFPFEDPQIKIGLFVAFFVGLTTFKFGLTLILLHHATKRVIIEPLERERAEAFAQALAAPAHQHLRKKHKVSEALLILPKPAVATPSQGPHSLAAAAHPSSAAKQTPPGSTTVPLSVGTRSPTIRPLKVQPQPAATAASTAAAHPHSLLSVLQATNGKHAPSLPSSSSSGRPSLSGLSESKPAPSTASVQHLLGNLSLDDHLAGATGTHTHTPTIKQEPGMETDNSSSRLTSPHKPHTPAQEAAFGQSIYSTPGPSSSTHSLSLNTPTSSPLPPLSPAVEGALTARFGRIHTPTALERFSSSMSPQALSPQEGREAGGTSNNVSHVSSPCTTCGSSSHMGQTPLRQEEVPPLAAPSFTWSPPASLPPDSVHSSPIPSHLLDFSRRTSSNASSGSSEANATAALLTSSPTISLLHAPGEQLEIVQLPPSQGNNSVTAVHIFHHQVPPQTTAGGGGGGEERQTDASSAASSSSTPLDGSSSSGGASSSYPPTVVTISAGGVPAPPKEKALPPYEDANKMEQELLHVQRYKISANKAIPV